jgi:superoxide dismutase
MMLCGQCLLALSTGLIHCRATDIQNKDLGVFVRFAWCSTASRSHDMRFPVAPLFCRPWTLNGMSPRLIESHYENNYGAALNHLNAVTDELESLDPGATPHHLIGRLKQDQIAALNSTLLHELYFASLGGDGRALPEVVAGAIARDFGSVDRWRHEFAALANTLAHGSGWVLLTYVPRDGRLMNQGASDHGQNIAGGIPILALDMYEHAYHIEFGANASAYIAGRRFGLGGPCLVRALGPAGQPMGGRPRTLSAGGCSDPRARHVRACLSS